MRKAKRSKPDPLKRALIRDRGDESRRAQARRLDVSEGFLRRVEAGQPITDSFRRRLSRELGLPS